jgi:uncharacterized membrane protein YkoI
MMRVSTAALLAAAMLAAPAAAQTTTPQPGAGAATPPAPAAGGPIGIAQALDAAKGRIDGGILEAELENEGGERVWEIDVAAGDSVHEVKVNATTGAVVAADEKTLEGTWRSWFDADSLAESQRIGASLAATIAKAEGEAGGRITSLELDESKGRLVYELELDTAGGEREMTLDPASGTVTPGD